MPTSAELARFVLSPEGKMWGRYCRHYGIDPGSAFADDVNAFQVGIAYMMTDAREQAEEREEPPELPHVVWDTPEGASA